MESGQSIPASTVSAVQLAFCEALHHLDMGPIARRLMHPTHGPGWNRQHTRWAIAQYLLFLGLMHYYPGQPLRPTRDVDTVWHTHILDTRKYREDCTLLFGTFMDHQPEMDHQPVAIAPTSALGMSYSAACIRPAAPLPSQT